MSDERTHITPEEDASGEGLSQAPPAEHQGTPPAEHQGTPPAEHQGTSSPSEHQGTPPGKHAGKHEGSPTPYEEEREDTIDRFEKLAPSDQDAPPPLDQSGEKPEPGSAEPRSR